MWLPIYNEHLSFDRRVFAKVRCRPINFHSMTVVLAHGIANDTILALK